MALASNAKTFEQNKIVHVNKNLEVTLTSLLEKPHTNRSDKNETITIDKVMVFTDVVETSGIDFSIIPTDVSPNNPPRPNW